MESARTTRQAEPLVAVRSLTKTFGPRARLPFLKQDAPIRAVDNVDLDIHRGETVGLVGESGSGKSTLGRAILHLTRPTSGQVHFDGQDLTAATSVEWRQLRRRMQIIFQDPYASLHPRMTVRETIFDALRAGGRVPRQKMDSRAGELIGAVGLAKRHLDVYPHRLSGGQRQRVAIARALSVEPSFIVADEPVSALDVSIQAQILNLLADIQRDFGLTYLFVSHDLNVIRYLSDRVAVMYRGRIVEEAPARTLFESAQHPYTRVLFAAIPKVEAAGARGKTEVDVEQVRTDAPPNAACAFYARCTHAQDTCAADAPALVEVAPGHRVACHRPWEFPTR